jgi:hypothetical protein
MRGFTARDPYETYPGDSQRTVSDPVVGDCNIFSRSSKVSGDDLARNVMDSSII